MLIIIQQPLSFFYIIKCHIVRIDRINNRIIVMETFMSVFFIQIIQKDRKCIAIETNRQNISTMWFFLRSVFIIEHNVAKLYLNHVIPSKPPVP